MRIIAKKAIFLTDCLSREVTWGEAPVMGGFVAVDNQKGQELKAWKIKQGRS